MFEVSPVIFYPLIINRYSHIRLDAQRAAVEALERIAPKPSRAKTHRPAKLAIIKRYSEGPYRLKQIQGADETPQVIMSRRTAILYRVIRTSLFPSRKSRLQRRA